LKTSPYKFEQCKSLNEKKPNNFVKEFYFLCIYLCTFIHHQGVTFDHASIFDVLGAL